MRTKTKVGWLGVDVVLCQERGRAQDIGDLPKRVVWIVVNTGDHSRNVKIDT